MKIMRITKTYADNTTFTRAFGVGKVGHGTKVHVLETDGTAMCGTGTYSVMHRSHLNRRSKVQPFHAADITCEKCIAQLGDADTDIRNVVEFVDDEPTIDPKGIPPMPAVESPVVEPAVDAPMSIRDARRQKITAHYLVQLITDGKVSLVEIHPTNPRWVTTAKRDAYGNTVHEDWDTVGVLPADVVPGQTHRSPNAIRMTTADVLDHYGHATPGDKTMMSAMYNAASTHESASDAITDLVERLHESVAAVTVGRTPFYGVADTAIQLERRVVERAHARDTFRMLAKIAGLVVVE